MQTNSDKQKIVKCTCHMPESMHMRIVRGAEREGVSYGSFLKTLIREASKARNLK